MTTYSGVTGAMQVTRITDPKVLRITAVVGILLNLIIPKTKKEAEA